MEKEKSLDAIVKMFDAYFLPKTIETYERLSPYNTIEKCANL